MQFNLRGGNQYVAYVRLGLERHSWCFVIVSEDPIWMGMTFHHLGLWLCVIFGAIAVLVSFFLIFMHATHYLKPWEQRQYNMRLQIELPMLINLQHYPNPPYGSCLRSRLLPFFPLLPTRHLFRSTSRLLRSFRNRLLLHSYLSLCCG